MRKFVAFLMLVLLPLQFSVAVAARYCQHETGPGAAHFGHHEHSCHGGQAQAKPAADGKVAEGSCTENTKLPGANDHDCGACHAGCAAALTTPIKPITVATVSTAVGFHPTPPASAPAARPERPNWYALA